MLGNILYKPEALALRAKNLVGVRGPGVEDQVCIVYEVPGENSLAANA